MHLVSSDCHKMGICLPLEFCSLTRIGDAFPWKAKARNVKQRILWNSSQRNTSSDLIHLYITQIFQSAPVCVTLELSKSFNPAELSIQLFSEPLSPTGKLQEDYCEKLILLPLSSSFCISLPLSLLEKAFAWIVCLLKKFSTPSTWKIWFSLEVISLDFSISSAEISTED